MPQNVRSVVWVVMACSSFACESAPEPGDDGGIDAGMSIDSGGSDGGVRDGGGPDAGSCAVPDLDGDGHASIACGGDDCDDDDPDRFPGNAEVCDAADHDEDCDPTTFGDRDADADGYTDDACCNTDDATRYCGDDCDDTGIGVHPDAPEVCNGIDDDCDGTTDEGVLQTYYRDADGDGYGDATMTLTGCTLPAGYVTTGTDCDDASTMVHPGAPGVCNCTVDHTYDVDLDSYDIPACGGDDCDDTNAAIHPGGTGACDCAAGGTMSPETCNSRDDDCNSTVDDAAAADAWCMSAPNVSAATCGGGACAVASCTSRYLDCTAAPGCETDSSTDDANCGACTVACGFGCVASACDDAVEIGAGPFFHTCARRASGAVVCWGRNLNGELGDGTTTDRLTPSAVSGLADAVEIAAGGNHTCARRASGAVLCWGDNFYGQLGDGTTTDRLTPLAVSGLADAVEIAAGVYYTCARRASGAVVCWGRNPFGQLGDGTTTDRLTPVGVSGLADAVEIATGQLHTCARRAAGAVVCWGNNARGQLGDGTTTNRLTPTPVLPP